MTVGHQIRSAVFVRNAVADADSIAVRVTASRMSESKGETIMKKYRIREGSIADYARYIIAGLMFGVFMGIVINTTYPIV